ncbi:DUF885 domain-containing protein [Euryhalocaulis caribicus]|uniref:DUF885 domain-containing protein n=1 Tax=Euryhalocaulis caribicus TaxID=1161401 RepID=UPI00039A53BF|nr:DUF885 domain-containing protein [Euryhalocaulis caribicus]
MKLRLLTGVSAAIVLAAACGEPQAAQDSAANDAAVPAEAAAETQAPADTAEQAAETESEQLNAWFEETYNESLERSPMAKTYLGVMDEDYGKWDNLTPEYQEETYELSQAQLAEMKSSFDFDALDDQTKLSWRLFEYDKTREKAGWPYREHVYTFNQMYGAQSGIPAFLINQHRVSEKAHAEAYVSRLEGVNGYLSQAVDNATRRADLEIMPPKFVYAHVLRDAKNVISGAPFDDGEPSALWADFTKKVDALDIPEEEKQALKDDARAAMLDSVKPAYENLIAELERQQEMATEQDGAWKLPDGAAYYDYRLKQMTTTDMSASEIHELGLDEVERIHSEMRAIMEEVEFDGTLQEFFEFMRTDDQFYYPNTDEGREAYLAEARALIDNMRGRLDEQFLRKPEADLIVKAVEEFREQSAGKAFYSRPAPDGSRPGTYYANLYDTRDMPTYQMEALAYHEGIPGHHMQIAIAQELQGIPKFRKYGGQTAYTEGWGLYSEWFPKTMGLYEDPYSDFGRLAMELWRAGRLVVDTGLHEKEWTREEAIDWLKENTPNPEGDIVKAIERYIVMPGQATAYKIGMLKFQELRERSQEALGDDFDIREYHETVLANGSLPLAILEEQVDEWIAAKQAGEE